MFRKSCLIGMDTIVDGLDYTNNHFINDSLYNEVLQILSWGNLIFTPGI